MEEIFARAVVSIIALDQAGTADAILMQRRTKGTNPHQKFYGLWELPQGKIRAGESILTVARRELHEETGLHLVALDKQHHYGDSNADHENSGDTATGNSVDNGSATIESFNPLTCVFDLENQCIGLAVIATTSGHPVDTNEASDHRWLTHAEIAALIANNQVFPLNIPMIDKFFSTRFPPAL